MEALSSNHRRYIINDFKLPKIVCETPYFEKQFDLLENYGFLEAFNFAERCISEFEGNNDLFFEEVSKLSHDMFKYLERLYEGKNFYKSMHRKNTYNDTKSQFKNNIYNDDNVNRDLIRVDINKACFNVLRLMTSELNGYISYAQLVHDFNEYDDAVRDYVAASKRIRSYIFGSVQKNVIVHLEKSIMSLLIEKMNVNEVVYKGIDELVMDMKDLRLVYDALSKMGIFKDILRVEEFTILPAKYGYVEVHDNKKVFKAVPSEHFCEVYADFYDIDIAPEYKVSKIGEHLWQRIQ